MHAEQQQVLTDLYSLYLKAVKPLLAEIESNYEKFPDEVLNEIRSFNDHIARCYIETATSEYIDLQLEKAKSHIQRIIFDCYKCLNVYYKRQIEKFEKQTKNIDLTLIDNGVFYNEYKKLSDNTRTAVREAKGQEHQVDFETAAKNYEISYNEFIKLYDLIFRKYNEIRWANVKRKSRKLVHFIIWLVSLIVTCILTNNNEGIVTAIKEFVGSNACWI